MIKNARVLGEPVKLRWLGWESDTLTLARHGWDISAQQDVERDIMRIAVRHPQTNVGGLSTMTRWEYARYYGNGVSRYPALPVILMEQFGSLRNTYFNIAEPIPLLSGFSPIDPYPSYIAHEPKRLEDLVHFATHEQKRIILPEDSVDDLIARILEAQDPVRQEHFLREAQGHRDSPTPRLEAQILSFKAA